MLGTAAPAHTFRLLDAVMDPEAESSGFFRVSAIEGKKIIFFRGQLQGEALHILKLQDVLSYIFKLLMPEDHTLIADDRVIGCDPQPCRGIRPASISAPMGSCIR